LLGDGVSVAFTGTTGFDAAGAWAFTVTLGGDAANALVTATNTDYTRFSVKGSGETTVHNAGLSVEAGGGKVEAGGVLVAADGAFIRAGGLFAHGGGASVRHGGVMSDKGGTNVMTRAAASNVAALLSSHASYTGTHLLLQTKRAASAAFNFGTAFTNEYHRQDRAIAVSGTNTADSTNITIRVEHAGMFPHRWRFKKDGDEEFSEEPGTASLTAAEVVEGEGLSIAWDALTGYTDGATFVVPIFKDLPSDTSWVSTHV
jgi:hypothetical protein